jgi:hypothetical protein
VARRVPRRAGCQTGCKEQFTTQASGEVLGSKVQQPRGAEAEEAGAAVALPARELLAIVSKLESSEEFARGQEATGAEAGGHGAEGGKGAGGGAAVAGPSPHSLRFTEDPPFYDEIKFTYLEQTVESRAGQVEQALAEQKQCYDMRHKEVIMAQDKKWQGKMKD